MFWRVLSAVALLLFTSQALADPVEFCCVSTSAVIHPEYGRLACAGDEELERGEAQRALDFYLRASKLHFLETPNFLIYPRLARAQAAAGRRSEALASLRASDEMLNIFEGKDPCSDPPLPESLAQQVMC